MVTFAEFYQEHREKLFAYLMRMTSDYTLASDILQEAFTRYLTKYHEKDPNVLILYRIARNALFDALRKQKRFTPLDKEPDDHHRNQEKVYLIQEQYRQVLHAFQLLDPEDREILALVAGAEFKYRQIAQIMGLSISNVKVKIHRARIKLRDLLKETSQ